MLPLSRFFVCLCGGNSEGRYRERELFEDHVASDGVLNNEGVYETQRVKGALEELQGVFDPWLINT